MQEIKCQIPKINFNKTTNSQMERYGKPWLSAITLDFHPQTHLLEKREREMSALIFPSLSEAERRGGSGRTSSR